MMKLLIVLIGLALIVCGSEYFDEDYQGAPIDEYFSSEGEVLETAHRFRDFDDTYFFNTQEKTYDPICNDAYIYKSNEATYGERVICAAEFMEIKITRVRLALWLILAALALIHRKDHIARFTWLVVSSVWVVTFSFAVLLGSLFAVAWRRNSPAQKKYAGIMQDFYYQIIVSATPNLLFFGFIPLYEPCNVAQLAIWYAPVSFWGKTFISPQEISRVIVAGFMSVALPSLANRLITN